MQSHITLRGQAAPTAHAARSRTPARCRSRRALSSSRTSLRCSARSCSGWSSVPGLGTYCRSSTQIGHAPGGSSDSSNCAPQVTQIQAVMVDAPQDGSGSLARTCGSGCRRGLGVGSVCEPWLAPRLSHTSTWTPSTSASSCSAGPSCAASRWWWRAAARARWSPRRATRRAASASSPPRPPSGRAAPARTPIFIPPDFEAYRARSREVMDVLRVARRAGRGRGARRGLPRSDRLSSARAPPRGESRRPSRRPPASAARSASGRTSSWPRSPPTPRSPTASSCSAPSRPASASPARRPACSPASARRPPSGSSARASPRWARSRPPPTSSWPSGSAAGSGPGWAAWRASRTIAGSRPCGWPSRSRARPPSTQDLRGLGELEPQLRRLTEQLCAHARARRAARAHDRHQGPLRRLLDRHQGALGGRAGQRSGLRLVGRAGPAAAPRPAAAGAPDRRARGRARRGARPRSRRPISSPSRFNRTCGNLGGLPWRAIG